MGQEIWKPISGYEKCYEISNFGNVKSLPRKGTTKKEKILNQYNDVNGYKYVCLMKSNKAKSVKVHRLVAQSFILNPLNKPQVNHINGIKTDNKVENLEWCTNGENEKHAYKIGIKKAIPSKLHIEKFRTMAKNNAINIDQYDDNGKFVKEWMSAIEIERVLKINHRNIASVCRGKRKKAGGYVWKYSQKYHSN